MAPEPQIFFTLAVSLLFLFDLARTAIIDPTSPLFNRHVPCGRKALNASELCSETVELQEDLSWPEEVRELPIAYGWDQRANVGCCFSIKVSN